MRVISKTKLREFWQRYPAAKQPLEDWYRIVKKVHWTSFAAVRETFRHADVYGGCIIFDIGGNKHHLIARVDYKFKLVFVRFVSTHAEYDEDKWKSDC